MMLFLSRQGINMRNLYIGLLLILQIEVNGANVSLEQLNEIIELNREVTTICHMSKDEDLEIINKYLDSVYVLESYLKNDIIIEELYIPSENNKFSKETSLGTLSIRLYTAKFIIREAKLTNFTNYSDNELIEMLEGDITFQLYLTLVYIKNIKG